MELERREFLKILGSATVATALPGCTPQKPKSLIPYIIPHEEIVPGKSVWYATTCRECPAGCGLHVRVREGRAVKVEGNPLHPVNQGSVCSRGQASLQGLYNPDRIQYPMRKRGDGTWEQLTWEQAEAFLDERLADILKAGKGSDIAFVTPALTGSLDAAIQDFLRSVGSRRRLRYEALNFEAIKKANQRTFGRPIIPAHDLASAKFILSFGADFLETWLSPVQYTREFTAARSFDGTRVHPFVYVGPRLSLTATNADEWIAPKPGTEGILALALVREILVQGLSRGLSAADQRSIGNIVNTFTPERAFERTGVRLERIRSLAREFAQAEPGLALAGGAVVGDENEVAAVAAVNLLNLVCGNIGSTVKFDEPHPLSTADTYEDVTRFVRSMEQGQVSALFVTEANPVFSTPPGLHFAHAMEKVPLTVALSGYFDETTAQAHLILPVLTPLESWGDGENGAGTFSVMQPVMQPVFREARMTGDILVRVTERITRKPKFSPADQPFLEYVKTRWQTIHRMSGQKKGFDEWWTEALAHGGFFEPPVNKDRVPRWSGARVTFAQAGAQASPGEYLLVTYPSINLYDGRGANKPWLQEVPDPMTQLTWENWVEIHPIDAEQLGVAKGDLVDVTTQEGTIRLPAYVYAGVRQGTVAIPLGQGHTEYGRYAQHAGANVVTLLPPSPADVSRGMQWSNISVRVAPVGEKRRLADVAGSDYLHGRNIVQVVTVDELLRQTKDLAQGKQVIDETAFGKPGSATLYPPHDHPDYRWGMTIDLDKCTGCSACVTACYAENNIPVVGKEQVELGRELSWLRVERYFDDPPADRSKPYAPNAEFLPMLCQQCDNAPCEPVCPVYAAYHTPEGLNAQVYNRCVGTRYCSNNCPYKVRRFNWYDYEWPEPMNWQLNPDVTVRSKGVMEKCTFCVQRIVEAKNNAREEGRPVSDGEITTACQQACPAQAITFGDLKDPNSKVNVLREKGKPRDYRVLEELNTQPAVVYLKEIRS